MKKEIAQIEPNIVNFTVLPLDTLELNEGQLEGCRLKPREGTVNNFNEWVKFSMYADMKL